MVGAMPALTKNPGYATALGRRSKVGCCDTVIEGEEWVFAFFQEVYKCLSVSFDVLPVGERLFLSIDVIFLVKLGSVVLQVVWNFVLVSYSFWKVRV